MKKLPLSDIHEKLGAKMVDFAGFYMPIQYTNGIKIEHETVRNSVGVFDVSHMGQIFIKGENSVNFLQYLLSNDVENLVPGKVQYTCMPNHNNGIVDDLLLYMIDVNHYMLVVNASNIDKDFNWLSTENRFNCEIINESDNYSILAVQGPKSKDLLSQITNGNINQLKYYNFFIGSIKDVDNIIISRTGYTGELGFELYIKNRFVEKVWNHLFNTNISLSPIGLAARDTLRMEKGFCLYGNDIDDSTSPIEAGLSWITKFNKKFINYNNLNKEKLNGPIKKLIGLELIDRGIARKDYEIYCSKNQIIGNITSGTMSPTLSKSIALGYVKTEYSHIGTELYVKVRNKMLKSKVVNVPFVE
tara:strand:+ start:10055 stop:11131 length:1077 start_codon:yes stop_codon:yes gene_type:complete